MPYLSQIDETAQSRENLEVFSGYNHNLRIGEGEWYDTKNLTTDYYPVMSQRKKRGIIETLEEPQGLLAKDAIAYIDDGVLYYNYQPQEWTTVHISSGEKQLVSMGAYLCIFPDGIYFNTEDHSDYGYMGASWKNEGTGGANIPITFAPCKMNGDAITYTSTGTTPPQNPQNGQYWLDTSSDPHVLKIYMGDAAIWQAVATTYVKISASGIGNLFKKLDGVTISGLAAPSTASETVQKQVEALNGTVIAYDSAPNYIVVVGLLDQSATQTSGNVTVKREVPDMDFVTECGNRLWGCKYGVVGGETVNEIYCCALGDFKNWRQYLGVSTDSWAGGVGTDGVFTGAITHLGYPLFFKDNCIHKVYPSASGAHQIVTTMCRGVQKGSEKSLAIVDETLFYKSAVDVCAYTGSLPQTVSTALGNEHYKNAKAGTCGNKYVLNMQNENDEWNLFVLDTAKGTWMHEDDTEILFFAEKDHDLYWINAENELCTMLGTYIGSTGSLENEVEWEAESGVIGFSYPDKKYLSRFNLRLSMEPTSMFDLYIRYDENPEWEHMGHIETDELRSFTLPIRPRRCDHLRIKLSGKGEIKLYSIAKILEIGSDY